MIRAGHMRLTNISRKLTGAAMSSRTVKDALRRKASAIASELRATDLDAPDTVPDPDDPDNPVSMSRPFGAVFVREGRRPGGRTYARLEAPAEDDYGPAAVAKRDAMQAAAQRHSHPKRSS